MKLPNASRAIIEERKLRDYLLSTSHPVGRFKARFFAALGFTVGDAEELGRALRSIAEECSIAGEEDTRYGLKYLIAGTLRGPSGKSADVITVWLIAKGDSLPRLVTVYPK